uniref:DUF7769 domain-containing protein n=1 Tax=Spongospora subterranea TaxID=70186 RepID=A0A0H5QRV1_9EUKA|eukprot:CRZ04735.1 hypothetical protein [Spongospora subterranea]
MESIVMNLSTLTIHGSKSQQEMNAVSSASDAKFVHVEGDDPAAPVHDSVSSGSRPNLTNDARQMIYEQLLMESVNGKLKRGSIKGYLINCKSIGVRSKGCGTGIRNRKSRHSNERFVKKKRTRWEKKTVFRPG